MHTASLGVGRDKVRVIKALDCAQVRKHKSLEAPFIAQNPLQQHGIGGNWDAIDLVVGSHHAHGVPIAQRRLKRLEHHCAQFALADVHRRGVHSALWRSVPGKVLGLGDHGVIGSEALALRALDIRQAELPAQVRVFAKILFHPAPAWIAGDVQHRPQNHVGSGRARLSSDGRASLVRNFGVPRCGQVERCREHCAIVISEQSLLNEDCGNAEPVMFNYPFLDGVRLFRRGIEIVNTADAQRAQQCLCFIRLKERIGRGVCAVKLRAHQSLSRRDTCRAGAPSLRASCG